MFEKEIKTENINCTSLTKKESFNVQREWLEIFAKNVKEQTGKWVVDNFLWSSFIAGYQTYSLDSKAHNEYQAQKIEEYFIFDNSGKYAFKCNSHSYPDFRKYQRDIYVMPVSKKWTMAYSHSGNCFFSMNAGE